MTNSISTRIRIAAFGFAAFTVAGLASVTATGSASAAENDKLGNFEIQDLMQGFNANKPAATGGTFTLTFNGQTTGAIKPIDGLKMEQEVAESGKKSGNVDFAWTIEKAEQGPIPVLMTIKQAD